jgi:hypothetical protein
MIPLVFVTMVQFAMTMTGQTWWDFMEAILPQKFLLAGF